MSKIYVIGIGPGAYDQMTGKAIRAMNESDAIIGYTVYVDLVKEYFPGKEFMTTPMKKEVDRCVLAFEEAKKGKIVSMICSGDAGVYGMAGLMYEVGVNYPETELEIIPGVTAATGGAAVLGAPLIHDFCLISLSDLLTPWEKIEARLLAAAQADFVVCLYNPSSKKRHDYLQKACDLMMKYKSPDTICGTVSNIAREGEEAHVMTLKELRDTQVDMFTTVFIGNSQTKEINNKMVTPRGYRNVIKFLFLREQQKDTKSAGFWQITGYRQRDLLPQSMAANPLQKMNFLLFRPEDWMQQPWRRPFYRRNRKWCWMLLILMLLR